MRQAKCPLTPVLFGEKRWPSSDGEISADDRKFLDELNLVEIFSSRIALLKSIPHAWRGSIRGAYCIALKEMRRTKINDDLLERERAWKLFLLISRLLLHRKMGDHWITKDEFDQRLVDFHNGKWQKLFK